MGKKKNLAKDNNGLVVQGQKMGSSQNCETTNCNGKTSETATNGVSGDHESEPPGSCVNGVNPDLDSTENPKQVCHKNLLIPSQEKVLANGGLEIEADWTRTNDTSDKVLGDVIGEHLRENSFSSPSESANNGDMLSNDVTPNIITKLPEDEVSYIVYESELQMPDIMRLIQKDLSEPYSIYTYRYFIHNWPHLCFMAHVDGECVGAIVCKLDFHKKIVKRGYIAMLAVDSSHRKRKIGSTLVKKAIQAMVDEEADEVVLETEITNKPALRLYENLGFVRDKRLFRYYLNGVDALRLKLWLR